MTNDFDVSPSFNKNNYVGGLPDSIKAQYKWPHANNNHHSKYNEEKNLAEPIQ